MLGRIYGEPDYHRFALYTLKAEYDFKHSEQQCEFRTSAHLR